MKCPSCGADMYLAASMYGGGPVEYHVSKTWACPHEHPQIHEEERWENGVEDYEAGIFINAGEVK